MSDESDAFDEAEAALREARARVLEAPAETVVVNHVMGLYELAAIHLSASPPNFAAASLAIDAVGCLVDGLGDRLGEETQTLRDALANIRMVFVSLKSSAHQGSPDPSAGPTATNGDAAGAVTEPGDAPAG